MTDLRKAAEMALEALETCVCAMQDYQAGIGITEMFDKGERMGRDQIKALRQALAQPKREWVGLTDEEISLVDWKPNETLHDYARDIEARLKEKNGG